MTALQLKLNGGVKGPGAMLATYCKETAACDSDCVARQA